MKKVVLWFCLIFVAFPIMIPVGILGGLGELAELVDSILSKVFNRLEAWACKD